MKGIQKLGLGGGCHWCTEAVFQSVDQVVKVEQGYIKSLAPYDEPSEAIILELAPSADLEMILNIHLQTHASSSNHSRRSEYRSAIYYFNLEDRVVLERILNLLSRKRKIHYVTQILAFQSFEPSREEIQDYYKNRPEAPFCQRYIAPKLKKASAIQNEYRQFDDLQH